VLASPGPLAYNGWVDTPTTGAPSPDKRVEPPRLCVYTALMGGYEELNKQQMALESEIPFICLTDDPDLRSETWQTRVVPRVLSMDPGRSQRDYKMRPHVHLSDFDVTLYIDNSVLLTQPPEQVFERYSSASAFCLSRNSYQATVLEEFLEVVKQGLDDQSRVFEQLNHYSLECPEVLEERPYWGGILLRDHRDPQVRAVLDRWYAHVLRYSRRDQLSVNAAFRQSGLTPLVMDIDNLSSWFHSWPHIVGRYKSKDAPAATPGLPVSVVLALEQRMADMERLHKQLSASEAWRVGSRLTAGAKEHPFLVGPLVRLAQFLSRR
jgi:hypothetical protein